MLVVRYIIRTQSFSVKIFEFYVHLDVGFYPHTKILYETNGMCISSCSTRRIVCSVVLSRAMGKNKDGKSKGVGAKGLERLQKKLTQTQNGA
jgi:hypothetical protein